MKYRICVVGEDRLGNKKYKPKSNWHKDIKNISEKAKAMREEAGEDLELVVERQPTKMSELPEVQISGWFIEI